MASGWERYFDDNRRAWEALVPVHAESAFYDLAGWKRGSSTLRRIELDLVGDVRGKHLLHLQCHFGLDTLSWARLGARVVGVDFSPSAIDLARRLAAEAGLPARFVECNVYDVREHVAERFDVVFTSYGVLGWLPDLVPWGRVIADSLVPGGKLVLVELHPYVWMSQDGPDLAIRHSYFNRGPITEECRGNYADRDAEIRRVEHGFNHPLSDVVNALVGAGLRIERLDEHDFSYWDLFRDMVRGEDGCFRFAQAEGMVPILFAIVATAPA